MIARRIQRTCLLLMAPLVMLVASGAVSKTGAPVPRQDAKGLDVKRVQPRAVPPVTPQPDRVTAVGNSPRPAAVPEQEPVATSASYEVRWSSVNAGGGRAVSPNYATSSSSGQTTAGAVSSPSYEAGEGFWEGTDADTSSVICSCPFQCDFNEDGALDPLDLNLLIEALFFGGPNPKDPACPSTRGDFNNSGEPDPIDLNVLIDHLFFAGPPPVDPCQ